MRNQYINLTTLDNISIFAMERPVRKGLKWKSSPIFHRRDWNGKPGTVFHGMRQNKKSLINFIKQGYEGNCIILRIIK
jgi:hypothetical protein